MALTMVVIGACATCLRHIRCPIFVIAPTFGIRTASERQEALQTLLSFICRGAAFLLPCWHNVRRPSRTLFRKRHIQKSQYGHLVIWSFGHFDVFQREQKGKGGTKGKTKVIKKETFKILKPWKRKPWKLLSISSLPCSRPSPAASAWWAACRLDFWTRRIVFLNTKNNIFEPE